MVLQVITTIILLVSGGILLTMGWQMRKHEKDRK
jgi:hypothetical protein